MDRGEPRERASAQEVLRAPVEHPARAFVYPGSLSCGQARGRGAHLHGPGHVEGTGCSGEARDQPNRLAWYILANFKAA